jgi:hypothetical protein
VTRTQLGWTLLTFATLVLALGIWDLGPLEGPLPLDGSALLATTPHWYIQAGYLLVAVILVGAGAWLLRGPGANGGGS